MDVNVLKGDWNILSGKVKEQWGKLTEDDLQEIEGRKDILLGKLQKQYGYTKEEAENQISEFEKKYLGDF